MTKNPLLSQWETPFGVPPFDQIKNEHYLPAFHRGIEAAQKEIDLIATSVKTPSFKNTIEAFELSGSLLTKIRKVFYAINGANTNDKLKNIAKEIAPKLAAHRDNIMLNEKLFQRVKTVYDQKENLDLTAEENKLLEETYKSFVRAGANVIAAKKERLREINAHLATLAQQFGENVLDETNSFELYVDAKKDLGNLSEGLRANASEEAKRRGRENGWLFTLQRPSINPFLVASPNPNLRKTIFDGYAIKPLYQRWFLYV
jgi:peptidyl-dipeptidase Dcp